MKKKYAKLRGRILEKFGTQAEFAKAVDISASTVNRKLNGYTDWTRQEVERVQIALDIPPDEVNLYFF